LTITGRQQWTSMYSFVRVATCDEPLWGMVLKLLDMWEDYEIKGLNAPNKAKTEKPGRMARAMKNAVRSKPVAKKLKNPKPFPATGLEKMFTGISTEATQTILQKMIDKEIGFISVQGVSYLFLLMFIVWFYSCLCLFVCF
jgi:hypothetical protein